MMAPSPFQNRVVRVFSILLVVVTVSLYILRQVSIGPYGKDFTMFLTGAHLLARGQGANLYDLRAQAAVQTTISGGYTFGAEVLPFNYPPYVAALFAPLTLTSPEDAYYLWVVVQWLILLGTLGSIWHYYRLSFQTSPGPVIMVVLSFVPVFEAILMGQMSVVLLAMWWWMFVSWHKGNWSQLGVALALAAFKPHLVLVPLVGLVVQKRWRALGSAIVTQAVLWGSMMLFTGPSVITGYFDILRLSASAINTLGFFGEIMINVRGLLATAGVAPQISMQVAMLVWVLSAGIAFWLWRRPWTVAVKLGFTALLAVLTSPHMYPHDASLLLLAVVFLSIACLESRASFNPNWLMASLAGVLIGMYLIVFQVARTWAALVLPMWFFACVVFAYLLWVSNKWKVAVQQHNLPRIALPEGSSEA